MIRYSTVFVLLFTLTGNIIKETLATSVVGRGSGGNVTEAPPTPKIGDTGDRQQTKDDLKDINTMPPMQRPPLDVKVSYIPFLSLFCSVVIFCSKTAIRKTLETKHTGSPE